MNRELNNQKELIQAFATFFLSFTALYAIVIAAIAGLCLIIGAVVGGT